MTEHGTLPRQGLNKRYIQKLLKELKLENSEAFYYSLVENIPQYIFCKDLEGRFTFVNQLFCTLLQKSIDDIIGKTDYDFFTPELAKKYREDDQRVIKGNVTLEDIEENKIPDGETKYVHVVKTPIHDANGNTIGIQGIFWDITSRKKAEEELKNANERMKQDLIAAAKVQRGFLPDQSPEIPGYRFAWLFEPSEYIGGDLLNVYRLDEHRWAFYVLDVSGHGVPAALLSVSLTRMIDQVSGATLKDRDDRMKSGLPQTVFDPQQLIHMLNRRFPGDRTKFCTLLYAVLNVQEGSVTWVRAGHVPPLLVRRGGREAEYFMQPGGMCINNLPFKDGDIQSRTIQLEPGDRFVIYSDGITEAFNEGQEYGLERFAEMMRETASLPLEKSLRVTLDQAARWTGNNQFEDDVTVLVLERSME